MQLISRPGGVFIIDEAVETVLAKPLKDKPGVIVLAEISTLLKPARGKPFVIFHDVYI